MRGFAFRPGALALVPPAVSGAAIPRHGRAPIRCIDAGPRAGRATLPAVGAELPFERQADGLRLRLSTAPTGLPAHAYRIELH